MTGNEPPPRPSDPRSEAGLSSRFVAELRALGIGEHPLRLLVAVSGGVDSVVLLHLLRFNPALAHVALTAAHFDHRMRPGSPDDALWLAGLCRAWEVPLLTRAAAAPLTGETDAREARYRFLRRAAADGGADLILTAHHADDQAETVLFRILRGTGVGGLRGIPSRTPTGLVRPLLPFWRDEIEAYATGAGLRWRKDPTNESPDPARNRLRLEILPAIERHIAPGARRNLVRLAELARESEEGWRRMVNDAIGVVATRHGSGWSVDREKLREYDSTLAARVVRTLLEDQGVVPSRSGTRSALQFITDAPSGRELQLASGLRVRTEFDRATLVVDTPPPEDTAFQIEPVPPGQTLSGEFVLAGRRYAVEARCGGESAAPRPPEHGWRVEIPTAEVRFPLEFRGRRPGDRLRTRTGRKSLKKLMIDGRIPRGERRSVPVLADATGRILWVAGIGPDRDLTPGIGDLVLDIATHG